MKKVAIIFTGGTITMKTLDPNKGAFPMQDPSEIIEALNANLGFDNLVTLHHSMIPSPSMTPESMRKLKKVMDALLDDSEIAGIVITHGTDTLEETSFYLDMVHTSDKPVVVTGAMKNASELGYDGFTNLVSSIYVSLDEASKNKGVLVVMNYEIHAASEVTKTHTLNVNTFQSLSFGPLGVIDARDVIYYRTMSKPRYHFNNEIAPNVPIIKTYTGIDAGIIEYYASQKIDGLIIEAMGRGNVPPNLVQSIERVIHQNIPVLICSRVPSGRVFGTYGYDGGGKDLVSKGAILAGDLTGLKARLYLMVALGNHLTKDQIRTQLT
jgi:L-asparaginase